MITSYQNNKAVRKEIKLYDLRTLFLLLWASPTITQAFFYKALKEPDFSPPPVAPVGAAVTPLPGSGRAVCRGRRSLLERQLRALAPNVENGRQQNKTTWTLVLSLKLGRVCQPSSLLGSGSDGLLFPTYHCLQNPSPLCHWHPRAEGRRRGLRAPCSPSLTKALWVLKVQQPELYIDYLNEKPVSGFTSKAFHIG